MNNYYIKNILVPTDFSDIANNALKTAIAIAKRQDAKICLFHVVENTNYIMLYPRDFAAFATAGVEMKKGIEESIEKFANKTADKSGIEINHQVVSGNVSDEICSKAFNENIDLIVMGTHGISGIREFFIGSNAYSVVKNAPCPVLSIPGEKQKIDFKKIVFPVRQLPEALDKYDFVKPIIEKNNSELLVLGLSYPVEENRIIEVPELISSLKSKLLIDGVTFKIEHYLTDCLAERVLQSAKEFDADMIVITANLDTNFKEFFIGPYAQKIINHSKHPVLSIRPNLTKEILLQSANSYMDTVKEKIIQSLTV